MEFVLGEGNAQRPGKLVDPADLGLDVDFPHAVGFRSVVWCRPPLGISIARGAPVLTRYPAPAAACPHGHPLPCHVSAL